MSRARSGAGRDAIVERMRVLRDDIQEGLFNSAAYWNSLHPHEEPIDPDPDGSMRRYLDALNRTLTRERLEAQSDGHSAAGGGEPG